MPWVITTLANNPTFLYCFIRNLWWFSNTYYSIRSTQFFIALPCCYILWGGPLNASHRVHEQPRLVLSNFECRFTLNFCTPLVKSRNENIISKIPQIPIHVNYLDRSYQVPEPLLFLNQNPPDTNQEVQSFCVCMGALSFPTLTVRGEMSAVPPKVINNSLWNSCQWAKQQDSMNFDYFPLLSDMCQRGDFQMKFPRNHNIFF